MSARPAVDVVVPFAGPAGGVALVRERMAAALDLRDDDTLTVVDDGAGHGSYAARNRGAAGGGAPWLLFLDADVAPGPGLLDALFAVAPAERTGVLAGGVRVDEGSGAAARFAAARGVVAAETTAVGRGRWAFAQTANCAVGRAAFAAVGGFRGEVRSGGDADLCFRLADAGWGLERRDEAWVTHRPRESVGALLRQLARHGAGAGWLDREHPGALPARRLPGLALWGARRAAAGVAALARGDRDGAAVALLDGPAVLAFELGRRLPNRAA